MKALIVGAGLAGLTAAVQLKRRGWFVYVMETRGHIGGNCHDYETLGVHVHKYGPHIFHTSDPLVWQFVNEFSGFTDYQHRVVAKTRISDKLLPVPYSPATAQVLGKELTDEEIKQSFFVPYSEKMWGCRFDEIPAAITSRVNLRRAESDTRYFTDTYQGMPANGYAYMFSEMDKAIRNIELGVHTDDWRRHAARNDLVVYTGPMDEYYDYIHGRLPYRAMEFHIRSDQSRSPNAVINWCDNRPEIRTTDYSSFYDNTVVSTVIGDECSFRWQPNSSLVPSHPMRGFTEADEILAKYQEILPARNTLLLGRLGKYQYMNMDVVIADTIRELEIKLGERSVC